MAIEKSIIKTYIIFMKGDRNNGDKKFLSYTT